MKRAILLLLTASLLLPLLAGCSDNTGGENTNTDSSAEGTAGNEEVIVEEEPEETLDAEIADLGGKTVTVYMAGNWEFDDFEAEEITGEAVNDAKYNANAQVCDLFNISLATYNESGAASGGQGQGFKTISNVVLSGTNDYDFADVGCYDVSTLAYTGNILDLNTVKNLDLSKSWWDPKANEQLAVKGKMFYSTGDIGLLDNDCTYCILFNKQVVTNYGLSDPYELVHNNEWVYDKFVEMADTVDSDLNGDGAADWDDSYGVLVWQDSVIGMLHASGGRCAEILDDGTISLTLNTERNVDVLTKWLELQTTPVTLFLEAGTDDASHASFTGDRCLFYTRYLKAVSWFRDMDTDFGILPYPKFTADQADFCNTMHAYGTSYICIPITAQNTAETGAVIEALAYYGKQFITPAYYEVTLKGKYFRDEQSAEMLDIIFRSRFFDVGMYYQLGSYNEQLITMMQQSNTDFASMYKRSEKVANKTLSKINDAFAAMGQNP